MASSSLWDMLPTTHQEDIIYLAWLLDHAEPLPSVGTVEEMQIFKTTGLKSYSPEGVQRRRRRSRLINKERALFLSQRSITGAAYAEFLLGEGGHSDELYGALDVHLSAIAGVPPMSA